MERREKRRTNTFRAATADGRQVEINEFTTFIHFTTRGAREWLKVSRNSALTTETRTQFMKRLVEFTDRHQLTLELAYYPPYHSKYNPIERCWGILENHSNGTLLSTIATTLAGPIDDVAWHPTAHPLARRSLRHRCPVNQIRLRPDRRTAGTIHNASEMERRDQARSRVAYSH